MSGFFGSFVEKEEIAHLETAELERFLASFSEISFGLLH